MLAWIGDLPDTVRDRSIEIEMIRKKPGEKVRRTAGISTISLKIARWAKDAMPILRDARPAMPGGLDYRAADAWEPLIAIADAAGGNWPKRARDAAVALSGDGTNEDDSVRVMLLADIREIVTSKP